MKLQFDPSLTYQQEAVAAVCDVFEGQTAKPALFTVADNLEEQFAAGQNLYSAQQGVGNLLRLDQEDLLKNVRAVQARHGLPQSESLGQELHFDIEMETGTGKTYVYLRTLLELNKRYGFTKFAIVVPSNAIKEGVKKTLDITKEHFRELYNNVTYDYFVYDSDHIEKIRDFAVNTDIQIMVIIIDAFQKKMNLINRDNDKKFGGARPIELLRETNPIVVIDEPQSTISTDKQLEAVRSLNPLCTLRYSATPVRVENKLYKLDAVDSFNKKLVKGIEVDSFAVQDAHNDAYFCLKSVDNRRSPITAKIEIDKQMKSGVAQRKTVTVRQGDDIYEKSGGRDVYAGYIVNDIYCGAGEEYVDFTSRPEVLHLHEVVGEIHADEIKRQQMRVTIEEHLEKELLLQTKGIKVLSLFFIDKVANYREYDDEGAHKGKYALWFEEIYHDLIGKPKYKELRKAFHGAEVEADLVHDGYFSADRARKNAEPRWKDTSTGTTQADDSAYNLIMKEKEKLLSFDCKVRFIFSHSALKEGWDNPNVFQICTLNETASVIKKRQEIGRGLRLCVNQMGERQYDRSVNILTVIANESYDEFAAALQREYQEDGILFGVLDLADFTELVVPDEKGEENALGLEKAKKIIAFFHEREYIDAVGKVRENLRRDLEDGELRLPEELEPCRKEIEDVCRRACGRLPIQDARKRETVELNKEVYLSEDFKELWDKIKWKTRYRVNFSTDKLLEECRKEMAAELKVAAAKIVQTRAEVTIEEAGVQTRTILVGRAREAREHEGALPDVVAYLQNETNLTRRTIVELLTGRRRMADGTWQPFDKYGDRLEAFRRNPQLFMEKTAKIVRKVMKSLLVAGIRYERLGDTEFYRQELFASEELQGYLESNMMKSTRSPYNYVIYDSKNERKFAKHFEEDRDVKCFAKLPAWFKISTPLGSYNPDWAILFDVDGEKKLYFVVETKGNVDAEHLRPVEREKIDCGKAHFRALGEEADFAAIDDYEKFRTNVCL
ncbi:DEAD/DEAH box helicase family protein [uncultured Selenomonas sp.]|uniref:type III restriction-modification system endonuclease n=1 Tax=uncultured Selenomonas sp. TaxID=159275 RepID=UPI0028DBFCD1|nr:DEAD/DEAH box helicase family protein [uncultured Selenomonas sp.]